MPYSGVDLIWREGYLQTPERKGGSSDGGLDCPTSRGNYAPEKEMGRQRAARSYMIYEARNDSAPKNNYGVGRERGRRRRNGDLRETKKN